MLNVMKEITKTLEQHHTNNIQKQEHTHGKNLKRQRVTRFLTKIKAMGNWKEWPLALST